MARGERRTGEHAHESTVALVRSPRRGLLGVLIALVVGAGAIAALVVDVGEDTRATQDEGAGSLPDDAPPSAVAADATRGLVLEPVPEGWVRTSVEHHPWRRDEEPPLGWAYVLTEHGARRPRRMVGIEAHRPDTLVSPRTRSVEREGRRLGVTTRDGQVDVYFDDETTGRRIRIRSFTESLEQLLAIAGHVEVTAEGITLVDRDGAAPPLRDLEAAFVGPAPPRPSTGTGPYTAVRYQSRIDDHSSAHFTVTVRPGYPSSPTVLAARAQPSASSMAHVRGTTGVLETYDRFERTELTWSDTPGIWVTATGYRVPEDHFVTMVQQLRHLTIDEWATVAGEAGATPPYGPVGETIDVAAGALDRDGTWRVQARAYRTANGGYADQLCVTVDAQSTPTTAGHHSCRTLRPSPAPLRWPHTIPYGQITLAFGAAGADITAIRLVLDDGSVFSAETVQGFTNARARWWGTTLPADGIIDHIVAIGGTGTELGRINDPRLGFTRK